VKPLVTSVWARAVAWMPFHFAVVRGTDLRSSIRRAQIRSCWAKGVNHARRYGYVSRDGHENPRQRFCN